MDYMIHAGRGLLILALVLSSCGPSSADMINRYRTVTEAKLAAIRAVGARVATEFVPTGGPFELEGPAPEFTPSGSKSNAIVMEPDHFTTPEPPQARFRLTRENPIANAATLLKKGELYYGSGNLEAKEEVLQDFTRLRYVLVIRNLEVKEAALTAGSSKTFSGGTCEGDALLYDLDRCKTVGGFRFAGRSSEKVRVDANDAESYLSGNLKTNTVQAIRAEFAKRYPGATPPYSKD
jgi:hypothetical protein